MCVRYGSLILYRCLLSALRASEIGVASCLISDPSDAGPVTLSGFLGVIPASNTAKLLGTASWLLEKQKQISALHAAEFTIWSSPSKEKCSDHCSRYYE